MPLDSARLHDHARSADFALREAIDAGRAGALAVEIIRDDQAPERLALLLSVADHIDSPTQFTCWLAYSNDPGWCNRFCTFGIPMLEARIELIDDYLKVHAAVYPTRLGLAPLVLSDQPVIEIHGVDPGPGGESDLESSLQPWYEQLLSSPDVAQQTRDVLTRPTTWKLQRNDLRSMAKRDSGIKVQAAAYPDLAAIIEAQGAAPALSGLTAGRLVDSAQSILVDGRSRMPGPPSPPPPPLPAPQRRTSDSVFGRPRFRFEDVEIVGFRVELPERTLPALQELANGLNFHRDLGGSCADFSYRVSTPTVVIELLRYGKMRSLEPLAPLQSEDSMSQHELIVRLLVGKVDDDGSQARDAAQYVPALFVDNPWSKFVGREMQGFKKEIAEFCIEGLSGPDSQLAIQPVGRDGRLPGEKRIEALTSIVQVRLPPRFGQVGNAPASPLLDIQYPLGGIDDDRFDRVDIDAILNSSVFTSSRWRQIDFNDTDFRRSFARQAMKDGFHRYRSVQVTPVDSRNLPKTWINGGFTLKDVQAQFPIGVAVLKLTELSKDEDDGWSRLCQILEGEDMLEISLPTGDWYRLKCSMDLSIENGLDW
ncbi:hypothetical protein QTH90_22185 [Variovorax sp. J2P1-59]|uniref:hypothetical protein n=1 Tax=Variovorax flavidus TaxID=3053501 RepID=UPI0025786EB1|nr:hypothetical protein [Variovorax sp. J2P1-59]MDM0077133.1 hypothetical protein [Variovorax sp. J2P1-59]